MDAIILAGGLGTRLRSVVQDRPKCMAPIGEYPFLHYLLHYLKLHGVHRIILSLGYLHEQVQQWIETYPALYTTSSANTLTHPSISDTPTEIIYSIESNPLGTGGAIKQALSLVSSPEVLILNGDTFFNIDLEAFRSSHQKRKATLSIALKPMHDFDRYGTVELDSQGRILAFHEKQFCSFGTINGGVYLLQTENTLFHNTPDRFSFETDILEKQVAHKQLFGHIDDNYFIDIGIPADYQKAQQDFKQMFHGSIR